MKVSVKELTERALLLLDENYQVAEEMVSFGDPCTELRRLGRALAAGAVRATMLAASFMDIDEVLDLDIIIRRDGDVAEVTLPGDFLRLVELRMSDWERSLYGMTEPVRKSVENRPRQVLRHHLASVGRADDAGGYSPGVMHTVSHGLRKLRIYGSRDDANVVICTYLPDPGEGAESVWIPRGLVEDAARTLAEQMRKVMEG